jgi:hypothetical protein
MLQTWTEKKAKDTTSCSDLPLIDYADFSDYIKLIERKDNWIDVFQAVFVRKEDVQESFANVGSWPGLPVRRRCRNQPLKRTAVRASVDCRAAPRVADPSSLSLLST